MVYTKSFPTEGLSGLPQWKEVVLSDQEERQEEQNARTANLMLVRQCIADARQIISGEEMREYQTSVVQIALSLFKKRSSHEVFWKDKRCRVKFDAMMVEERAKAKKRAIIRAVKKRKKVEA